MYQKKLRTTAFDGTFVYAPSSHERDRSVLVGGGSDERLVDVVHGAQRRHVRHVDAVRGHGRDRGRVDPRETGRLGGGVQRVARRGPLAGRRGHRRRRRRQRSGRRGRRCRLVEVVYARARDAQVPVAAVLVLLGHARRPSPHRRPVIVLRGESQLLRRLQAAASAGRKFK